MGFRSPRLQASFLFLLLLVGSMRAQVPSARAVLELSEAEQTNFVNETMNAGFPADRADQMTMLTINRSALVLPLIERRVEAELRSSSPPKEFVATATEMIAYAGDEQSLQAISKLMLIDGTRFGSLVERTLDNALDFRNPFTVAYRGLSSGDDAISQRIGRWADSRLTSQRMQRLWAEAMVDRYKQLPDDVQWMKDPLILQLKILRPENLRESVVGLAKEAAAKRDRRQ